MYKHGVYEIVEPLSVELINFRVTISIWHKKAVLIVETAFLLQYTGGVNFYFFPTINAILIGFTDFFSIQTIKSVPSMPSRKP
jgi:hypothetical protein